MKFSELLDWLGHGLARSGGHFGIGKSMWEVNNGQVNANQLGIGNGCGAVCRHDAWTTRGRRVDNAWTTRGQRVDWPVPLRAVVLEQAVVLSLSF